MNTYLYPDLYNQRAKNFDIATLQNIYIYIYTFSINNYQSNHRDLNPN